MEYIPEPQADTSCDAMMFEQGLMEHLLISQLDQYTERFGYADTKRVLAEWCVKKSNR
jgi:hypothetical protein